MIIPTADTVRYIFLLNHNIKLEKATLYCGPTGTGKTIYIKNLLNKLPREEYSVVEVGFSA